MAAEQPGKTQSQQHNRVHRKHDAIRKSMLADVDGDQQRSDNCPDQRKGQQTGLRDCHIASIRWQLVLVIALSTGAWIDAGTFGTGVTRLTGVDWYGR